MERFYYSRLVKVSLIRCDCYQYDTQLVGFIGYTDDPDGFLRTGIMNNLPIFCFLVFIAFLNNPMKFVQLIKAFQLERAIKTNRDGEGAILSFGVLPEYRNRKFVNDTGLQISNELFEYAVEFFKQNEIRKIRLLIEPDNREAIFFYMQYGCKFEKIHSLGRTLIKASCTL